MRKIDEKEFVSFTIMNGCTLRVYSLRSAIKEFSGLAYGTLYGTKYNGEHVLIDKK